MKSTCKLPGGPGKIRDGTADGWKWPACTYVIPGWGPCRRPATHKEIGADAYRCVCHVPPKGSCFRPAWQALPGRRLRQGRARRGGEASGGPPRAV